MQIKDQTMDNSIAYRDGIIYAISSLAPQADGGEDVYEGAINAINATDGGCPAGQRQRA